MDRIVIIGSGMAGFGASHRFHLQGIKPIVYEQGDRFGGHTRSFVYGNQWTFDDGPHVSFTKDKRIQGLFAEFVDQEFETVQVRANNFWQGHWIKHPAICNLYGLPSEFVVDCISDFVQSLKESPPKIQNYKDWLLASYGRSFYENFPKDYTQRYHTLPAERMDIDWLGPRLYKADLKEVLFGAISPSTPDVHYVTHFRYPKKGGFEAYLKPFPGFADIQCNHEALRINPTTKTIDFKHGAATTYDHLISTLPLPELIRILVDVPKEIVEAAQALAVSTCIVVNIGLNRQDLSDSQWTYFYDHDFFFTRLSFPHLLSPQTVPPGTGAIQAECYYSRQYRPCKIDPMDCIDPVIRDLKRCGLIRETDEILFRKASKIDYANVIFDLDRKAALQVINPFLDEIGIYRCGRYAEWGYHWTDESFKAGEDRAQRIIDQLK